MQGLEYQFHCFDTLPTIQAAKLSGYSFQKSALHTGPLETYACRVYYCAQLRELHHIYERINNVLTHSILIFGKNGTDEKCLIFMPRIDI